MFPQARVNAPELLIVEDNPADARLLEVLLEDAGIDPVRVARATRLDDARACLASGTIDAILLDLGLPDADGVESLQDLSERLDTPIIVVSGNDDPRVRDQAASLGAVDYLLKHELVAERLGQSVRAALRRVERSPSSAGLQTPTDVSIDRIVTDACVHLEDTLGRRLVLSKRLGAQGATVSVRFGSRPAVEQLLHGLAALALRTDSRDVRLKVRTTAATDRVIVAVDIVVGSCPEAARHEAMKFMMGQGPPGDPRQALAGALESVRHAGGNMRCGSGGDGRLWVELNLPRSDQLN